MVIAILLIMMSLNVFAQKNLSYVNSLIGSTGELPCDYGATLPAVGTPFGMTQWCAQTRENKISVNPYHYDDTTILGFIGTHQPAIWMGDYGYVSMMPQSGMLRVLPQERKMYFKHKDEKTSPYFYQVKMTDKLGLDYKVKLASTERCGFLSFTFPKASQSHLIIQSINVGDDMSDVTNSTVERSENMIAYIKIDNENNEITGYNPDRFCLNLGPELKNFKGYFVIRFDRSFREFGIWNKDSIFQSCKEMMGKKKLGAYITFSTMNNRSVKVKIATSFISLEQARVNMEKEIPDWNFESVVSETKNRWDDYFNRITVKGGDKDQKINFYSALYRTLQYPRIFSEYGKYYSAFDDKIHDGVSYNDFSMWDTFRALHPLFTILVPERVNPMIQSMVQMYQEGGWLPKWPNPTYTNIMISTPADAIIADAYVKGFHGYDVGKAWDAVYKDAMCPPLNDTIQRWRDRGTWQGYEGRAGLTWYKRLGYVPADKTNESVSNTMESSFHDFCVAQMAKALGKWDDYKFFLNRSRNYKNLYNPATGFFSPRLSNGEFCKEGKEGFTEGSPWTYLFCVMHDVDGLIATMGGKEMFLDKLDRNFSEKHYVHGNEPGHHYIYLYDYAGKPSKTQELVYEQTKLNYKNAPDGLSGNDDCGQMSAWLIFTSMGFYPVAPSSGEYAIGRPLFEKIIINNGENNKIVIETKNFSPRNKYVQSVTMDGVKLTRPFLKHADLMKCNNIRFVMGPEPKDNWNE